VHFDLLLCRLVAVCVNKAHKAVIGYSLKIVRLISPCTGAGYDYDNVTGVYHKSDVTELDGVLESIVKQNLPRTYGHINSDEADDFDIVGLCAGRFQSVVTVKDRSSFCNKLTLLVQYLAIRITLVTLAVLRLCAVGIVT